MTHDTTCISHAAQPTHILKFELPALSGSVTDIAWSPDSQRIVAVGEGREMFGRVFMWDSGTSVGEITGHSKKISSVDFKQTRPFRIATCGDDFQVAYFEGPPFKFNKVVMSVTCAVCDMCCLHQLHPQLALCIH